MKHISGHSVTLLFLAICTFFQSCTGEEEPVESVIPVITMKRISGNVFNFMSDSGSIQIGLELRDGDKDMGLEANDSVFKIKDIRSDSLYQELYLGLPRIPRETIDGPTLVADVLLIFRSTLFTPRADSLHLATRMDTLNFEIQAVDDAGNWSNIITTDTIYIMD